MNRELPDVQAVFRKGRGTRDQTASIHWIIKKARVFQKTSISALLTMPKPLTVWITINCGKLFKRWEYQTTLPASWKICMQVKKQQLGPAMEQQTDFKVGKEYVKAVYCHPAYLTYMQSTSWEMPGWVKHKLESSLPGARYTDETTLMAENKEQLKSLLMKEEWKGWLKTQHSENQDHGIWSHLFMANRWGNNGNSDRLFSWAPKSLQMVTAALKLKGAYSLEEKLWPT